MGILLCEITTWGFFSFLFFENDEQLPNELILGAVCVIPVKMTCIVWNVCHSTHCCILFTPSCMTGLGCIMCSWCVCMHVMVTYWFTLLTHPVIHLTCQCPGYWTCSQPILYAVCFVFFQYSTPEEPLFLLITFNNFL